MDGIIKQFVMREPRFGAKSVLFHSEQGKPQLWVIGGFSSHGDLNLTELIRPFDADPEFTQENRLPFTIGVKVWNLKMDFNSEGILWVGSNNEHW